MRKKQKYVNIPTELAEELDQKFVGMYGHKSRSEFVVDATRRLIAIIQEADAKVK